MLSLPVNRLGALLVGDCMAAKGCLHVQLDAPWERTVSANQATELSHSLLLDVSPGLSGGGARAMMIPGSPLSTGKQETEPHKLFEVFLRLHCIAELWYM